MPIYISANSNSLSEIFISIYRYIAIRCLMLFEVSEVFNG